MQELKTTKSKIEALKENSYSIDFGVIFEEAFENYKKIVWYAGLMFLVFSFVMLFLIMTGLIAYIGTENIDEFSAKLKQFSQYKVMPTEVAIPLNTGILLFSALISPFMTGFFKMAHCAENDMPFHVSTMFSYYKSPYFITIVFANILISFTGTGLAMLLENIGLSFVGTLLTLLLSFLTFLTIPILIFGKLNVLESIQASIMVVSKQPLTLLGLLIVAGIASLLGIFIFCLGFFFTYPFVYSMYYTIYKNIIGIDEDIEI